MPSESTLETKADYESDESDRAVQISFARCQEVRHTPAPMPREQQRAFDFTDSDVQTLEKPITAPTPAVTTITQQTSVVSGAVGVALENGNGKHSPAESNGNGRHKPSVAVLTGEKGKANDILTAIEIINRINEAGREATAEEQDALARFGGFGAVALRLFPDPVTGKYKDAGWQALGEKLRSLLSPDDYDSAKRTTFNAFYTSPKVMTSMHQAMDRLGVPENGHVLEPGCGIGNFMGVAPDEMQFIGVELDRTSGRIAQGL